MNDAMPEPMGLRIEADLHDGRRDMHTLRGDVVGRQAPRRPRAVRVFALDGDKWKEGRDPAYVRRGGGGFGLSETQVSYTLTATDRHIVGIIP